MLITDIDLPELSELTLYTPKHQIIQRLDTDIQLLLKTVKTCCPTPKIIVDYSCGNGYMGITLAKIFSNSLILLIADQVNSAKTSESNIKINNIKNIKLILGDLSDVLDKYIPDIVIVRSTGYEGKKRLEKRMELTLKVLKNEGHFIFSSHKKKGASSYLKMMSKIFSSSKVVLRSKGYHIIQASKTLTSSSFEEIPSPEKLIQYQLNGKNYTFETESCLFSKDHVDPATHILLENLEVKEAKNILDLGTGYGVIGIVLADLYPQTQVTMVDVNLNAIKVAHRNVKINNVSRNTEVILSDGLSKISDRKFDLVVSNFPLHIPYEKKIAIIEECKKVLTLGGRFYVTIVRVDQYDLRPLMDKVFGNVMTVVETGIEGQGVRVSFSLKKV